MTSRLRKRVESNESSLEDYYRNKNFVPPKEKTLETIFEEPKVSKKGTAQLTSSKKLKRFLHFDDIPSSDKLRKRRKRAQKYAKNFINLSLNEDVSSAELYLNSLISTNEEQPETGSAQNDCDKKNSQTDLSMPSTKKRCVETDGET